jgi:hypothetical protein
MATMAICRRDEAEIYVASRRRSCECLSRGPRNHSSQRLEIDF